MSSDSYSGAGLNFWHNKKHFEAPEVLEGFTDKHMQYAVYKCAHTFKMFLRVVLVILIVWVAWVVLMNVLDKALGIKIVGGHMQKSPFTQENLQYLGASTEVTLEQREIPVDTLAQKAAAAQKAFTAGWDGTKFVGTAAAKPEKFTEHMTPEEKEMEKIKKLRQ